MAAQNNVTADDLDRWRERIEQYLRNPDGDDLDDVLREMHDLWVAMQIAEAK